MARERLTPAERYGLLGAGWICIVAGVLSYPIPLVPSTTIMMVGLLLLAPVQPWARAAIVRLRRRFPPFNRAHGFARRRAEKWFRRSRPLAPATPGTGR